MNDLIELQSLVETHERPFVVIGRDHQVVAVNRAYEQAFNTARESLVGQKCHRILHHRDRPCNELGEECPYVHCYLTNERCSCLHTHYDSDGGTRWVRVDLYPIKCADGKTYVGEMMHEIAARDAGADADELRPVGGSAAFLHAMEQLEQAAKTDAPVLLIGETGTGKELAARFIHHYSARRNRPYVAVDCTVITESLFESEVFGHERGAFTGSVDSRKGLFEVAADGTLFLDEIGEASLATQAKLLRVLEAGEFRRVGGNKMIKADARIICATNRQLWQAVLEGQFREDLYYRIACFCVRIPPLRERLADIPQLAHSLLRRLAQQQKRSYRLDDAAIELLQGYHYPGNIRELRNILQVAVANLGRNDHGLITREAVRMGLRMRDDFTRVAPESVPTPPAREGEEPRSARALPQAPVGTAPSSLGAVEAEYIASLLGRFGGNRRATAEAMGISERTLYRKLAKYGLSAR